MLKFLSIIITTCLIGMALCSIVVIYFIFKRDSRLTLAFSIGAVMFCLLGDKLAGLYYCIKEKRDERRS
jgi:hypothetical protein